jgi:Alfin
MESGSVTLSRRTVEDIFKDFSARRSGIVRALTHGVYSSLNPSLFLSFYFLLIIRLPFGNIFLFSDVDDFYLRCDPGILHFRIFTAECL